MRDRNLEKNIKRVEGFIERWRQLSQYLDRGFHAQDISTQDEAAFLELKSNIAQEHELLMITLVSAAERDEKPLRLLNAVPSLAACKELPEDTAKRVATDWHNTYMALQALLGRLKGRQEQLATISSFGLASKRVFANPLLVVLFTVAAAYGVYKFGDEWIPKLKELMERKP